MNTLETVIQPSSVVLVTGANGFLASHVTSQLLERGFKVRGTVRDLEQSSWLLEDQFEPYVQQGHLELVPVPDLGAPNAYDAAVKDVAAILHISFIANIVPDPNEVVTPSVNGVRSIFGAAMKEAAVKRIVFTSSAVAAYPQDQREDNGTVGLDSWNEAAIQASAAPPPYGMPHLIANYAASKALAEKEAWKLLEEEKPHFSVNVVSPAGLFGEPLCQKHIETPSNWVTQVYRGNKMIMDVMPAGKLSSPIVSTVP
jgi:nucleoside-diphosphate-sugar epimerase